MLYHILLCTKFLRCRTASGSLRLTLPLSSFFSLSFNSPSSTSIVFVLVVSVQSSSSLAFSSSSSSPSISLVSFLSQFSWTLALSIWSRRFHHQPQLIDASYSLISV